MILKRIRIQMTVIWDIKNICGEAWRSSGLITQTSSVRFRPPLQFLLNFCYELIKTKSKHSKCFWRAERV